MKDTVLAMKVFESIHVALRASDKTRDPMNALVVWTELGKGLAGKLERQGADPGLLGRLVTGYCRDGSAGQTIDLARWAYNVEPARRLTTEEAAQAVAAAQREIENHLLAEWGDGDAEKHQMESFLATVRGWFPAGLDIVRSLPGFRGADEAAAHAALGAWCERYFPKDTSGPGELGVRAERTRSSAGT